MGNFTIYTIFNEKSIQFYLDLKIKFEVELEKLPAEDTHTHNQEEISLLSF